MYMLALGAHISAAKKLHGVGLLNAYSSCVYM